MSLYTTQNKFCISYIHVCNFCIGGKIETNMHLEQLFIWSPRPGSMVAVCLEQRLLHVEEI